jgi:AraC-like DNA-binding protein
MLYLTGIILSCFLALLLLLKKDKATADRILCIWMFIMALHQGSNYLDVSKISYTYPHLLGIGFALPLLHGLLLHFYVLALLGQRKLNWSYVLPHFIPFIALTALAMPFYQLPAAEKIQVFLHHGAGYEWYMLTQLCLIVVSGFVYVLWSFRLIHAGQKNPSQKPDVVKSQHLQWLKYLSLGLAGIWVLVLFFNDQVIFGGVTTLVCLIGILGINQVPVFVGNFMPEPLTPAPTSSLPRYAKSGLSANQSDALFEQLTQLMEKQKVYKKPELSLGELAELLSVHPNSLSQVINEKTEKNFYQYINKLRVEAFLQVAALPHKQHYSLLALAFECGFNSKSTFNKYFKTVTGETPSEYFSLIKY